MAAVSTQSESSTVSSAIQVSSLTGGQTIFQSGSSSSSGPKQQFLLVSPSSALSAGGFHILSSASKQVPDREEAVKRREILARQPSYCKILNELKEAESSGSEDSLDEKSISMKGEQVDIVEGTAQTQTVVINGQQYQIVAPSAVDSVLSLNTSGGGSHFSTSNGTVFIPSGGSPGIVTVGSPGSNQQVPAEEQARKREIRLAKNREAARECRNKKKEYIKCLENRVAVLENQNKALIEELKSLKELYKTQN